MQDLRDIQCKKSSRTTTATTITTATTTAATTTTTNQLSQQHRRDPLGLADTVRLAIIERFSNHRHCRHQ